MSEIVEKYPLSWFGTAFLTVSSPVLETLLPLFSQIVLILCVQVINIGVDQYRQNKGLRKRESKDLELPKKSQNDENDL